MTDQDGEARAIEILGRWSAGATPSDLYREALKDLEGALKEAAEYVNLDVITSPADKPVGREHDSVIVWRRQEAIGVTFDTEKSEVWVSKRNPKSTDEQQGTPLRVPLERRVAKGGVGVIEGPEEMTARGPRRLSALESVARAIVKTAEEPTPKAP